VWPFPSVEADLFYKEGVLRVRKFKAARDSAALRLSGSLDTRKRIVSAKASGELDIAGWIAAGAPGFRTFGASSGRESGVLRHRRRPVERSGRGGPTRFPERGVSRRRRRGGGGSTLPARPCPSSIQGTRKAVGGHSRLTGTAAPSPDMSRGRRPCAGFPSPRCPGRPSAFPFRLPGREKLPSVSRERRIASKGRVDFAPRWHRADFLARRERSGASVPDVVRSERSISGGRDVTIDSFRLLAGKAESRGDGEGSIPGETVRLRGSLSLPAGKSADYGVGEPIAWEKVAGEWEISGPFSRLRGKASLAATALAIRALPPLPVSLRIDGVPSEALLVAVDVPAQRFKATAEGTWTFPFDPSRTASEWTVAAREIDCPIPPVGFRGRGVSGSGRRGGAPLSRRNRGKGEADGRIRVAEGKVEATGRFKAPRVEVRGSRCGPCGRKGSSGGRIGDLWNAHAEGKFGDGTFHVAANGDGGNGTGIEGGWRDRDRPGLLPSPP